MSAEFQPRGSGITVQATVRSQQVALPAGSRGQPRLRVRNDSATRAYVNVKFRADRRQQVNCMVSPARPKCSTFRRSFPTSRSPS